MKQDTNKKSIISKYIFLFSFVRTIPDNPMMCENYDCNGDTRYGMHENYDYYLQCKLRERNMGLFTADQVYIIAFKLDCNQSVKFLNTVTYIIAFKIDYNQSVKFYIAVTFQMLPSVITFNEKWKKNTNFGHRLQSN